MSRTPVFVLTGFLGAGKSTLLNRVLRDPAFARTAIIINEFGDIALDHDLVRFGRSQIARTTTGCLCCTVGSDIRATLHDFHVLAAAGEAVFDRVIVETTGLGDPAPLVNDLVPGGSPAIGLRDHIIARTFELAGVVALVDIVHGELAIENHFEAAKQIAFADRIVLTKCDLARDPASINDIETLKRKLATLNPSAHIRDGNAQGFDPASLFEPRTYVPAALGDDVTGWLALEDAIRAEATTPPHGQGNEPTFDRHGGRIRTFALTRDEPIEPDAFRKFMGLMSTAAGPRLLRAKGLVHLAGDNARPRVIHAVQHVVHPTRILDHWPSEDHRTRLVFITDGVEPQSVRQLFEAALDNRPSHVRHLLSKFGAGMSKLFGASGTSRMQQGHRGRLQSGELCDEPPCEPAGPAPGASATDPADQGLGSAVARS